MIKNKVFFLNKTILYVLLTLLVLMPFGTFLIQLIKLFFESVGISLPSLAIKAIYAWKELLLVLGLFLVLVKILLEKNLPFKIIRFDLVVFGIALLGALYGGFLVDWRLDRIVYGFRYDFLVFLFYFLARSVEINKDMLLKSIKLIILISLPIMLFGIAQTFLLPMGFMEFFGYSLNDSVTGNPLPPYHLVGDTVRAMSTFPGPNSFAMYLVFILLSALFFGKQLFGNKSRLVFILLSLFTLGITFSRGHVSSLFIALVLGLLFFKYFSSVLDKKNIKKIIALRSILATLVISILFTLIFFGTFWIADLSKNQNSKIGSLILRETSTQAHSFMRALAFEPIKEKPYGHGIGTAGLATTNIADGKFNPESWPIQLVFEYGWLGLIFFLSIIFFTFNLFFTMFIGANNKEDKKIILFFMMFFIAIITSTNFLPSWFEVGSLMWWILWGIYISNLSTQKIS